MKRHYASAVVLGKFMPPHHGHRLVINAAQRQSNHVTLIVSTLPGDPISSKQRVDWLHRLYLNTTVAVMPVTWDVTNAQAWAAGALAALGGQRPQAVFSSETYGQELADIWGCDHVMVDDQRLTVPVSASDILEHPKRYQHYLDPLVQEYFFGAGKGSRTPFISLES